MGAAGTAAANAAGAAAVEFVLAVPLLFLILLFAVQAGLWFHATHVAQTAAARALDAARVDGGSAARGQQAGADALRALGGNMLLDPAVTVTRTATQARVEITGRQPPWSPARDGPCGPVPEARSSGSSQTWTRLGLAPADERADLDDRRHARPASGVG